MKSEGCWAQRGVGMVEVLIAALILGVGMLGLMGLQTRALQYNQQAYLFSQATLLVQDLAERMRANRTVLDDYVIDYGTSITGVASNKCMVASCTENEIATWDLKLWKDLLAATLPKGNGEVVKDGDLYKISAQFETRDDGELQTVTISVQI